MDDFFPMSNTDFVTEANEKLAVLGENSSTEEVAEVLDWMTENLPESTVKVELQGVLATNDIAFVKQFFDFYANFVGAEVIEGHHGWRSEEY
jgi:hypothetical protein